MVVIFGQWYREFVVGWLMFRIVNQNIIKSIYKMSFVHFSHGITTAID